MGGGMGGGACAASCGRGGQLCASSTECPAGDQCTGFGGGGGGGMMFCTPPRGDGGVRPRRDGGGPRMDGGGPIDDAGGSPDTGAE